MESVPLGAVYRLSATFKTGGVTLVDPTTVAFRVRDGAGVLTTLTYGADAEVTKTATGSYSLDVDCAVAGTWHARLLGTGSNQGAETLDWVVMPSQA